MWWPQLALIPLEQQFYGVAIALEIAPFVTRNCNCKLRETLKKDRPHYSHSKSKWRKPSISRTGDKGRCNLAKLKSLLVCLEHMKMYVHAPLFCLGFWSLSLRHLYKTSQQFKMHWFFACTLTNNLDSHCCNLKLMRLSTTKMLLKWNLQNPTIYMNEINTNYSATKEHHLSRTRKPIATRSFPSTVYVSNRETE